MTGERRGTMILAQRKIRVRFRVLRSSTMARSREVRTLGLSARWSRHNARQVLPAAERRSPQDVNGAEG
jgi:hypothetical protein